MPYKTDILSLETYKNRANKIHNNKYDYTLVDYTNLHCKIKIICPIHGIFEQEANGHLKGYGCSKCSKTYKYTTEEIIEKSTKTHTNKYDYSLVNYVDTKTKIQIICKEHGIFEQLPYAHIRGSGCPICYGTHKFTTIEFIKKSKELYGDDTYDYSLVEYIGAHSKIKIICKKHGMFEQMPASHLRGKKCIYCVNKKILTSDFIDKLKIIHSDKYDYSLVEYFNAHSKIKIICKKHGVFEQISNEHLKGCGCPKCSESKGEKEISKLLKENNVDFETQKKFNNCKNIFCLPFDFFLPKYNLCIEYDGEQHFNENHYFNTKINYKKLVKRDKIKTEYCLNNNIELIRIRYDENINENINEILNKIIN